MLFSRRKPRKAKLMLVLAGISTHMFSIKYRIFGRYQKTRPLNSSPVWPHGLITAKIHGLSCLLTLGEQWACTAPSP